MIRSMTGYGKAVCQLPGYIATVEVRCLNSKSLDINLKIPANLKDKEHKLRAMTGQILLRGKAELVIGLESQENNMTATLNKPLMEAYYKELSDFADQLGSPVPDDLITTILRLPDILRHPLNEPSEAAWDMLIKTIKEALDHTNDFRLSEGAHLENELRQRINMLSGLLEQIRPLLGVRAGAIREKILRGLEEINEASSPDPNRFEQEMIYYLEKLDITEEMVRLDKHLSYFTETIDDPEPPGKKLGFIAQEIGREINTIGSKANDADIQKIVVRMKDELEKIKEQLMNIL